MLDVVHCSRGDATVAPSHQHSWPYLSSALADKHACMQLWDSKEESLQQGSAALPPNETYHRSASRVLLQRLRTCLGMCHQAMQGLCARTGIAYFCLRPDWVAALAV